MHIRVVIMSLFALLLIVTNISESRVAAKTLSPHQNTVRHEERHDLWSQFVMYLHKKGRIDMVTEFIDITETDDADQCDDSVSIQFMRSFSPGNLQEQCTELYNEILQFQKEEAEHHRTVEKKNEHKHVTNGSTNVLEAGKRTKRS